MVCRQASSFHPFPMEPNEITDEVYLPESLNTVFF